MYVHQAPSVHRPQTRPATDILEEEDGIWVLVNMPGVSADDVMVEMDRNELSIRGRSHAGCVRSPGSSEEIVSLEFVDVDYGVRIALPETPEEGTRARLRNGMLSVFLPHPKRRGPRRIFVESV